MTTEKETAATGCETQCSSAGRSEAVHEAALAAADFAAMVFLAPEMPELEARARSIVPHLKEVLASDTDMREGALFQRLLASEAAGGFAGLGTSALDVRREHAKLFLGVGEETIPLSISVWTSEKGLLRQDAAETCSKLYAQAGVALDESAPYDPDHIGTAFAFLSLLELRAGAAREAAAKGDAIDTAETVEPEKFFGAVIAPAFSRILKRISARADAPFYAAVGTLFTILSEEGLFG